MMGATAFRGGPVSLGVRPVFGQERELVDPAFRLRRTGLLDCRDAAVAPVT
jgi:hypothetical protein